MHELLEAEAAPSSRRTLSFNPKSHQNCGRLWEKHRKEHPSGASTACLVSIVGIESVPVLALSILSHVQATMLPQLCQEQGQVNQTTTWGIHWSFRTSLLKATSDRDVLHADSHHNGGVARRPEKNPSSRMDASTWPHWRHRPRWSCGVCPWGYQSY